MLEIALLVAPLFVLLGIGMAAGFAQRFRSAQAGLNAFVFNFALPAHSPSRSGARRACGRGSALGALLHMDAALRTPAR